MNYCFNHLLRRIFILCSFLLICIYNLSAQQEIDVSFENVHPWRPPFGLERVGQSTEAIIRVNNNNGDPGYTAAFLDGNHEIKRQNLQFDNNIARILIPAQCKEMLVLKKQQGDIKTVMRKSIPLPVFECNATARPKELVHPIDAGVILVPADWLLLKEGQTTVIDIAVISRNGTKNSIRVKSWFASAPNKTVTTHLKLDDNKKTLLQQAINFPITQKSNDRLHIELSLSNKTIWQKEIPVMITRDTIKKPAFGVVKTKLRYDVPITNIVNGKNHPFNYDTAWSPEKQDYIVFLPNGSRWVFWRGASYIPVWVSKYNTALSYEWAERISPNEGFTDCPEPLMDKELRYGKVEIIESTTARIHVRWSYQSCDFNYKVNGDFAQEDYYFYPDGLGTRVLTLTSLPQAEYEVAEFILLAPQAAIPFAVMPGQPMDMISFKTGTVASLSLPQADTSWENLADPVIYRMKIHKEDPASAFSFNPLLIKKPFAFAPFKDNGLIVTPAYWGGHWPLSQGFNTGRAINESIWSGPSHNSLITWGPKRPFPTRSKIFETMDALGVKKRMREETFVWLIGMTNISNDTLFQISKSFAEPAKLSVQGGWQEPNGYSSERRSFNLVADSSHLVIDITPRSWCINPVFEIKNSQPVLLSAKLGGELLPAGNYAWDGNTLWINAYFNENKKLELEFGSNK